MTKARQLADLGNAYDDGALSHRNLIINGGFDVWQRGTSGSVASASSAYVADRWATVTGSGQTAAISRQEFTDGQTDVPQARYFHRIVNGSSTTEFVHFDTRLEEATFRPLSGATVTLTFYAKASSNTVMGFEFAHKFDGSSEINGSHDNVFSGAGNGFSLTTEWQKFTLTHTFPSYAGKTFGGSAGLAIRFVPSSASYLQSRWGGDIFANGTVDIAQVQLEVGDTATPFEHRSYGDELARCQRYYEEIDDASNAHRLNGVAWAATNTNIPVPYLVEKRANPTVAIGSAGQIYTGAWTTSTGSAVTGAGVRGCTIDIQSTGLTTKNGYFIRNHELTIDAEL